jgi:large subunit ribosomal protein L17
MRHRIAGKKLSRDTDHRRAMLRNLAAGLFEHGQIETTMPKAKAVQPFVERIITTARQGTLASRRRIESMLNDRKIHAWVADPAVSDERKTNPFFELPDADQIEFNRYGDVRKAPRLVQHIVTTIAPMFAGRAGGYTRIIKLGKHRLGDGTDLVLLQLVGREEGPELSGGTSGRRRQADRRAAFASQIRKAAAAAPKAARASKPEAPAGPGAAEEPNAGDA